MRMSKKMSSIVAAVSLVATGAYAADGAWNLDGNGTWKSSYTAPEVSPWLSEIALGAGSTANFTYDITADRTVSLGESITIGNMVFEDTGSSSDKSWILGNGGSASRTLTLASGTMPTITTNSSATISAVIDGTNGLNKAGSGTLTLSGANSYSGGTTISAGAAIAGSSSAFGTGTITVGSGALQHSNSWNTTFVVSNNIVVNSASSKLGSAGDNGRFKLDGTLSVESGATLTADFKGSMISEINGTLSGAGVFFLNSGLLALNGANDIAEVKQSSGTLLIGSNSALGKYFNLAQRDTSATIASSNATARVASGSLNLSGKPGQSTIFGQASGGTGNLTFTGNGTLGAMRAVVNNTTEFSGSLSGTAALVLYTGSTGTLIFSGANTYGGTVAVNAGTLRVNNASGSGTGTAAVTLGGGTLGGDGSIGGAVTVNSGILAPGNSVGSLGMGSLTLIGGTVAMEIGGPDSYDMLDITGALAYGGTLNVTAIGGFDLAQAGSYNLFDFGSSSGLLAAVNVGGVALAQSEGRWTAVDGDASYAFDQGTGVLTVVVPEPTMVGLVGAVSLLAMARRRRAR